MATTFDQTPYSYTQSPQLFRDLLKKAESQTVRVAMFGDSQETIGGNGNDYVASLSYQFWLRYHNIPETAVYHPVRSGYWHGKSNSLSTSGGTIAADKVLPGQQVRLLNSNSVNGQGSVSILWHDGKQVAPNDLRSQLLEFHKMFPDVSDVRMKVFGVTAVSSSEINVDVRPTNQTNDLTFFGTTTQALVTTMGLQDAVADQFVSQEFGTLDYGSNTYMNVRMQPVSASPGANYAGVRYSNANNSVGVSLQSFSEGGYVTGSVLGGHGNAGPHLVALGPWDAVVLKFGANDSFNKTPAQYKADTEALIAALRGPLWLSNPALPIIVMCDVYRTGLTSGDQVEFDQMPGVLQEIAESDPFTMSVNIRRIMDERGMNADNPNILDFIPDGVHYSGDGGREIAAAEVAAMFGNTADAPAPVMISGISRQGRFHANSGQSHYVVVSRLNGSTPQVWDDTAGQFVDEVSVNWQDVDVPVNETLVGSGRYRVVVPAAVPAGMLHLTVYQQMGASPATDDTPVADSDWAWDGSSLLMLEQVDGVSDVSYREALFAYIAGESTLTDNGNGTKTLDYKKQDGVTSKVQITFNNSGEFTATQVS